MTTKNKNINFAIIEIILGLIYLSENKDVVKEMLESDIKNDKSGSKAFLNYINTLKYLLEKFEEDKLKEIIKGHKEFFELIEKERN